jgi:hypothetical protein
MNYTRKYSSSYNSKDLLIKMGTVFDNPQKINNYVYI